MHKPFEPGNTSGKLGGRPRGARNKLSRKFLEDCYADWQEHGAAAINIMRLEDPAGYCKMMASLVPRELELTSTVLTELSDDDLEATIQLLLRQKLESNILNKLGQGKFHAYSAGSQPEGQVNPRTIQLLQSLGYDTSGLRSKSWNEFAKPGAPPLDFAFTVCDNAAGEICPVWPGQPMTAHWGVPDPAGAKGSPAEIALAFKDAYRMLHQRIGVFTALPIRSLDQFSLQQRLREIGQMDSATAKAKEPS